MGARRGGYSAEDKPRAAARLRGVGRMDVRLITKSGVEERGVEELPLLLQGEDGLVWVDIPAWTMRQCVCSRRCSGFTRWPWRTPWSVTVCQRCTPTTTTCLSSCMRPNEESMGMCTTSSWTSSVGVRYW
jgi:hypothetical protein